MSTRRSVLHDVTRQMGALLPDLRVTRSRTLAWFMLGLLWAGTVSLTAVAAHVPGSARTASTEQRLRRWLTNPAVVVETMWSGLLPALLASRAGHEVIMVIDPPPAADRFPIVQLGIVCRHRVLPVAWRVMPLHERWSTPQHQIIRELIAQVAAALPKDCSVTVVADRGLTCATLIDSCRAVGWHFTLRVSANERQGPLVRLEDGSVARLWDLVPAPGSSRVLAGALFTGDGWRSGWRTVHWCAALEGATAAGSRGSGALIRIHSSAAAICAGVSRHPAFSVGMASTSVAVPWSTWTRRLSPGLPATRTGPEAPPLSSEARVSNRSPPLGFSARSLWHS